MSLIVFAGSVEVHFLTLVGRHSCSVSSWHEEDQDGTIRKVGEES